MGKKSVPEARANRKRDLPALTPAKTEDVERILAKDMVRFADLYRRLADL